MNQVSAVSAPKLFISSSSLYYSALTLTVYSLQYDWIVNQNEQELSFGICCNLSQATYRSKVLLGIAIVILLEVIALITALKATLTFKEINLKDVLLREMKMAVWTITLMFILRGDRTGGPFLDLAIALTTEVLFQKFNFNVPASVKSGPNVIPVSALHTLKVAKNVSKFILLLQSFLLIYFPITFVNTFATKSPKGYFISSGYYYLLVATICQVINIIVISKIKLYTPEESGNTVHKND